MINADTVGVMDSGVGGLSVLKQLIKTLPTHNFVYLGDTANLPYGCKTKEQVLFFNRNILNFFISLGIKNVAIACNTTSALTFNELDAEFSGRSMKIFPLIQSAAQEAAAGLSDGDCVCVLSTAATAKSAKYSEELKKINPNLNVIEIGCPGFVEIVENRRYNSKEAYQLIEEKMKIVLQNKAKRVILGCTHYPYLVDILSKFAPREIFFNPACAFAKNTAKILGSGTGEGKIDFYVTKNPEEFKKSAKLFFDIKDEVKCVLLPEFSLR